MEWTPSSEGCGGEVYRSEAQTMLNSGAVTNIMSESFEDRLSAIPENTNKHITVANGVN